jgi:hypothetical protein
MTSEPCAVSALGRRFGPVGTTGSMFGYPQFIRMSYSRSSEAPIEKSLSSRDYRPPRLATGDDIAILEHHRAATFASMGSVVDAAFTQMVSNCGSWFHAHIAAGTYLGYLIEAVEDPPRVIAGGGLLLLSTGRRPIAIRGPRAATYSTSTSNPNIGGAGSRGG